MGKCKFQDNWMKQKDKNGYHIKDWLTRTKNIHEGHCIVCNAVFTVERGFHSVNQHCSTESHRKQCEVKLSPYQQRLEVNKSAPVPTPEPPAVSSSGTVKLYDVRDSASRAELIWSMKVVASDYSASSCDGIVSTFQGMFGNGMPENFSMSSTKHRYLVCDALAPYFKQKLIEDMDGACFSLSYDETTNAANRKELSVRARYWSNLYDEVVTTHLQTYFIDSATSKDLCGKLDNAMKKGSLDYSNLVALGSDGPNVNKAVFKQMNDAVLVQRKTPLMNIGTCSIHTVHNAFHKGLEEFGEEASDLVFLVHNHFDGWPSRVKEFKAIQKKLDLKEHAFVKHVSSRWLSLEPAATRLVEQWPALKEYFLKHVPISNKTLAKSKKFQTIAEQLRNPTMKAQLLFVISSAQVFSGITKFFQKDEPLVHLLHDKLTNLLRTILGRICKSDNHDHLFCADNLLAPDEVIVTEEIKGELNQEKISPLKKMMFFHSVQKHYQAAAEHIMNKTPVKLPLLKAFRCLQPAERKKNQSLKDIVTLAQGLPIEIRTDVLQDEWKLLTVVQDAADLTDCRIDKYWSQFFKTKNSSQTAMFPTVTKVVKAALSVPHGNADVEREFSSSGRTLTDDKASMCERTLDAHITVKEVLRLHGNKPENVPITTDLLKRARLAYQNYREYLEEKKKEAEAAKKQLEEEEKRKIDEKKKSESMAAEKTSLEKIEKKLKNLRNEEKDQKRRLNKLLEETNARLKTAISKKNMDEISLAQAMLEAAQVVQTEYNKRKREVDDLQKSVDVKKAHYIDNYCSLSKKQKQ